jgi:uncharacterized protein DUF3592
VILGLFYDSIGDLAPYALILAGAATSYFLFYGRDRIPEWFRSLRAGSWRVVSGSVETAEVTAFHGRSPSGLSSAEMARVSLGYSYQVDGEFYSGYFFTSFKDEQEAWNFADRWKGKSVVIRYNPAKPDVSVLRMQEQTGVGSPY